MKHITFAFAFLLMTGNFGVSQDTPAVESTERAPHFLEAINIMLESDDVRQQAGINEWAARTAQLCLEWFPYIDKLLESEGFTPPTTMNLRFRNMGGVAHVTGNNMVISSNWVRPGAAGENDWGMVIHELVHIIQQYPGGGGGRGGAGIPGWAMEGLTDYIRHVHFEPNAPMRPFGANHNFDGSFQITAGFFMYIVENYDRDFITELNRMGRTRTWTPDVFEQRTGKTAEALWESFTETVRQPHMDANTRMIPSEQFPNVMRYKAEFAERLTNLGVTIPARAHEARPQGQRGQGQREQGQRGARPQ